MLANVYMNRFLKYWRSSGRDSAYRAQVVTYADDFVILSRGHAEEAMKWMGQSESAVRNVALPEMWRSVQAGFCCSLGAETNAT
jgi:hypothetical protein